MKTLHCLREEKLRWVGEPARECQPPGGTV
jgi:hypothetical protein